MQRFNTQPPEGGWHLISNAVQNTQRFNTQPPEGGWAFVEGTGRPGYSVSTRSRPKAAGFTPNIKSAGKYVSTRSRPKAAGASLKSLAPSGFAALISLGSQEKREREYNTAFSVTPAFAIS